MKKMFALCSLIVVAQFCSHAQAAVIWKADFSAAGVANWQTYAAGATINPSDGKLVLAVTANSWDAGSAYPVSTLLKQVPVSSAKMLNFNIVSKTNAVTYDIALDEFNSDGVYLATKWNVVANPGPVGSSSVDLTGLTYDPGTEFVLPKINVHTTAANQSITVASLDFGGGKESAAKSKPSKIEKGLSEKVNVAGKTAAWSADFSQAGIANWQPYGAGASISSSNGRLVISATENTWDAGGAIPVSSLVKQMPVSTAKKLDCNVASKSDALTYDVALDEFNSEGVYVSTKWNVIANPGPVGPGSVSLDKMSYDAGTVYILPKINIHTTGANQSITVINLTISE